MGKSNERSRNGAAAEETEDGESCSRHDEESVSVRDRGRGTSGYSDSAASPAKAQNQFDNLRSVFNPSSEPRVTLP